MMDGVSEDDLKNFVTPTHSSLCSAAASWSDGVIVGEEGAEKIIENVSKPTLQYQGADYIDAFNDFYEEVLAEEGVLAEINS